jgi:hypothetical protein
MKMTNKMNDEYIMARALQYCRRTLKITADYFNGDRTTDDTETVKNNLQKALAVLLVVLGDEDE